MPPEYWEELLQRYPILAHQQLTQSGQGALPPGSGFPLAGQHVSPVQPRLAREGAAVSVPVGEEGQLSAGHRDLVAKEFQMERRGQSPFDAVEYYNRGDTGDAAKAFLVNMLSSGAQGAGAGKGLGALARMIAMRGSTSGASTPYASPHSPSQGSVGPYRLGESSSAPGASTPYASPHNRAPAPVGPYRLGESSPTSTPHDAAAIARRGTQQLYPEPDPNLRFLRFKDPASLGAKSNIHPATKFLKQKDFVVWLLEQGLLK